jgi:hypothetical protein
MCVICTRDLAKLWEFGFGCVRVVWLAYAMCVVAKLGQLTRAGQLEVAHMLIKRSADVSAQNKGVLARMHLDLDDLDILIRVFLILTFIGVLLPYFFKFFNFITVCLQNLGPFREKIWCEFGKLCALLYINSTHFCIALVNV